MIDKYILTSFLRNLAFGIFCFVIVFILVDLFENIDKFIDRNLTGPDIAQYYLYFIPEIVKLITPVGMLLATLFTTARFNSLSEMTAMNSAGISIYRYLLPLLIVGVFVTAGSIYFNGWIVPYSNTEKIRIEKEKIGKHKSPGIIPNLSIQDSVNRILTIRNYNENQRAGENASIQIFTDDRLSILSTRIDSRRINWDSSRKSWILTDVTERSFDSAGLNSFISKKELGNSANPEWVPVRITPDRINIKQKNPDELILSDLRDLITEMRNSGQDVSRAEVDYYSKISFPFANLIVIIFGVSLSLNQRKGSAAVQFGISILITFLYLGFVKISQTFGYNGEMDPVLTAWLANILFLALGIYNFLRTGLRS
ncbi:MAG: LptF/LptG family permease [Ignavibacteria bacterium]|nr:LptF/LptG family permease [Ignavibacteria bacterium]